MVRYLDRTLALREPRRKKADGSFVTDGDLLCQSVLSEALSQIAPEYTIVSEEASIPEFLGPKVAVIDPIDGTENFTSGLSILERSTAWSR